jgi:NAD-dependent dihydropyrimidine dehydrogenase PreA subunit
VIGGCSSQRRGAWPRRKEGRTLSTEIYYFSGTGNSLHVAKELQNRVPGTKLVPIVSLAKQESVTTNGESVGFVFPHYASTLPEIVHTFIEKLDVSSAEYLFAVVTRGRTKTMAFAETDRILKAKGRRLDAHFVFTMPSGSEPLVKAYASQITQERIGRLEADLLARLDSVQRIVLNRETSREDDRGDATPPPWLVPFMPLLEAISPYLVRFGKMVESTFDFYYDDKCTACGVCEHVCLSTKVKMVEDRPKWQEAVKCHGCFACLNYCPEESIQVESRWYLKSHTEENGRYRHPAVTADEIARQKTKAAS